MSDSEKDFEQIAPENGSLMSNKDAQTEANMLRAKMDIDMTTGLKESGENPWSEEYDRALAEVEDLIKQAQAEPISEIVTSKINRFIEDNRSVFEFLFTNRSDMTEDELAQSYKSAQERHESNMKKLQDAAKKLNDLKSASKKYKDLPRE